VSVSVSVSESVSVSVSASVSESVSAVRRTRVQEARVVRMNREWIEGAHASKMLEWCE
jgi:hypothetical protein